MPKKKDIRHDFQHVVLMGLSTGVNAILGLAAGMLLVRALPPEEYGLLSSALAVMLVAQELVGRGINDGLIRLGTQGAAGSTERVADIFQAGFALKGLFCLVVIAFFFLIPRSTLQVLGFQEIQKAFPAAVASIVGFALWSYMLSWHQARLDFGRLALIQPAYNLLRIGMYLAVMSYAALQWVQAIWFMAAANFISVVVTGTGSLRVLVRNEFDWNRFRQAFVDLVRCSGWGMVAAVAFVTLSRMDIFILTHYKAPQEVALYNGAWQLLSIIDLLTITIMTVMTPKIAHLNYFEEIMSWVSRTLALGFTGAIFTLPLFFLANWYVPLFLGTNYTASVSIVKIMYWGNVLALLSFPLIGILNARMAFKMSAAIQVLLLTFSIPAYGLAAAKGGIIGVAWTTFGLRFANAVIILSCALMLLRRIPCRISAKAHVR